LKITPLSPRQKSLCSGGRSTQKIGGLFNASFESVARLDWAESDEQTVLPMYTPSPPHSDLLEFLFPSKSLSGEEERILSLLPETEEDPMVGSLEGGEDGTLESCGDLRSAFADLEDLLLLDPTHMAELSALHELTNANDPTITRTPLTQTATLQSPDSRPQNPVIPQAVDFTLSPDHSYYTTVKQSEKRKFSEMSNDDKEEDEEEEEEFSVCGSSYSDSAAPLDTATKRTKYIERRMKNNVASKRSREIRKNKYVEMDEQAVELEKANEELRKKIEQLERLTLAMKDALVAKLSTSK
jgi:leukemia factor-related protein